MTNIMMIYDLIIYNPNSPASITPYNTHIYNIYIYTLGCSIGADPCDPAFSTGWPTPELVPEFEDDEMLKRFGCNREPGTKPRKFKE